MSTPTRRAQSSPAKFKEHYSHLTYASRRTNEDEEGATPSGTPTKNNNSKNNSSKSPSSQQQKRRPVQQKQKDDNPSLKLPALKLISGFAISEDGHLMSRFVSPPRFGLNNLEDAALLRSGGGGVGLSPSSRQLGSVGMMNSSGVSMMSQSPSPRQRVFMATVSRDANGNAKINILNNNNNHQKSASSTEIMNDEALLERAGGDPWLALLNSLDQQQTGLTERELALLEWNSVKKIIAELKLSFIIDNPLHRAKAELQWRKVHDRVLAERIEQEQRKQQEREEALLLSSSSTSAAVTKQKSLFAVSDAKLRTQEFSNLIDQLYPPSPVMQAVGGPVILVRTAPQGEILLSDGSSSSGARGDALNKNSGLANATFVHHRKIPTNSKTKSQFGQTVESSPLRHPALVKQVPKQF